MIKGFRIDKYGDFIALADQVQAPKMVDTNSNLAFFYAKKRFEYQCNDSKQLEELAKKGFVLGHELEILDQW